MKQNRILLYLCLALPALLLQSCLKDDKDYFDENSSQRMENYMENAQKVLESSENGWAMEYYPDRNFSYGGMAYAVKFNGDNATVYYEGDTTRSVTSLYKIGNDDGPILSFDSYNELMHFFATPNTSEYEAKDGDFEFVIDSVGENDIVMHGKRNQNNVYLHRLTDKDAETYIKDVSKISNSAFLLGYNGTIGAPVQGTFDLNSRSMSFANAADSTAAPSEPFCFTDKGIRLYQPVTVNGKTVQNFVYNDEAKTLTCTDEGAEDVVLNGILHDKSYQAFGNFAGTYLVTDYFTQQYASQGVTRQVVLTPNQLDRTYTAQPINFSTGENDPYTISLTYDKNTGTLVLAPQILTYDSSHGYYIAMFAVQDNNYFSTSASMSLVWNGDSENPVYNFVDNGDVYPQTVLGYYILGYDPNEGSVEQELDESWYLNGIGQYFYNPQSMRLVKTTNE